jgi:hypothetical protein
MNHLELLRKAGVSESVQTVTPGPMVQHAGFKGRRTTVSLNSVSWFEIGLVKSAPNTTDGIPLQMKLLCVIELRRGISEGLMTNAYGTAFANMLGVGSTDRFRASTFRPRTAPQGREETLSLRIDSRQPGLLMTFECACQEVQNRPAHHARRCGAHLRGGRRFECKSGIGSNRC